MEEKLPNKFCYAVFCNVDPVLVYAIYDNKQNAVRYALSLIRYRRERALERGCDFGFYHFNPFIYKRGIVKNILNSEWKDRLWMDERVFTACLRSKDALDTGLSDDDCSVRVIRYPLRRE
jgi:hypothetical protein